MIGDSIIFAPLCDGIFASLGIEIFAPIFAEVKTVAPTAFDSIATVFGLFVISLCLTFWAWWIAAQQKLKQSRIRFAHEPVDATLENDWRLLQNPEPLSGPPGNLVISMILVSILSQLVGPAFAKAIDPTINLGDFVNARIDQAILIIMGSGVSQIFFIAVFFILREIVTRGNVEQPPIPWIRISPQRRDWLIGIVGWIAIIPLILILMTALSKFDDKKHPFIEKMTNMAAGENQGQVALFVAAIGVSVAVLAPIAEEILFRGLIFGWFRNGILKIPFWPANVFNGLLFGLAHFGQGLAPIPLFFLALGLGYIYERTGRLWPCIVVHGLLNLMTFVALVAQLKA